MPARDALTQLEVFGPVFEGCSVTYKATILDETGTVLGELGSLKVTLFDKTTGVICNKRRNQSILNENGGTFDDDTGILTLVLDPADTLIIDQTRQEEDRVMRFDYTYDEDKTSHHAVILRVRNLPKLE